MNKVLLILLCTVSCSPVISTLMGIKEERNESIEYQQLYLMKLGMDTAYMAVMDPFKFEKLSGPNCLDTMTNQDFTPVQFRIYDQKGGLFSGWEICFGSARQAGIYDSFPGKAPPHWPLNYSLQLFEDLSVLRPVNYTSDHIDSLLSQGKYDYVVISFWAGYLGSLSRHMLQDLDQSIRMSRYRILHIKVNLGKKV